MSGSAGAHWSMHNREDIRNESLRVARLLGCVNETNNYLNVKEKNNFTTVVKNTSTSNEFSKKEIDKKMLECLKGKKAQDIVNNSIHVSINMIENLNFNTNIRDIKTTTNISYKKKKNVLENVLLNGK